MSPNRLAWTIRLVLFVGALFYASSQFSAAGTNNPDLGPALNGQTDQGIPIQFEFKRDGGIHAFHVKIDTDCDNAAQWTVSWDPEDGVPIDIEQRGGRVHAEESGRERWKDARGTWALELDADLKGKRISGVLHAEAKHDFGKRGTVECASGPVTFKASRR